MAPCDLLRQTDDLGERGTRQVGQDGHGDIHHDDWRAAVDPEPMPYSARDVHGVSFSKSSFLLPDSHSPSAGQYDAELGERVIMIFESTSRFEPVKYDGAAVPFDHRPEANSVRQGDPS